MTLIIFFMLQFHHSLFLSIKNMKSSLDEESLRIFTKFRVKLTERQ